MIDGTDGRAHHVRFRGVEAFDHAPPIGGVVEVRRHGVVISTIGEPGAILGEMSALLERPHTASVVAVTPVEAYGLDDGIAFLADRPALALHVATLLAQRLDTTTGLIGTLRAGAEQKKRDTSLFERLIGFLTGQAPAEPGARRGGRPAQPRPR